MPDEVKPFTKKEIELLRRLMDLPGNRPNTADPVVRGLLATLDARESAQVVDQAEAREALDFVSWMEGYAPETLSQWRKQYHDTFVEVKHEETQG